MTLTGAIVVYAVTWFLALYIALPIGERSQSESGEVVPGTPASAPEDPQMRKKLIWVTVVTTVIWAVIMAVVVSGVFSIEQFDIFDRMS
jgi:predicted secreted protein